MGISRILREISFIDDERNIHWIERIKWKGNSEYRAYHTEDGVFWTEKYRTVDGIEYKVSHCGEYGDVEILSPIDRYRIDEIDED